MRTKITPDEVAEMTWLYEQFRTYAAVARKTGRSASAAAKYIMQSGTPNVVKKALKKVVRKQPRYGGWVGFNCRFFLFKEGWNNYEKVVWNGYGGAGLPVVRGGGEGGRNHMGRLDL